MDLKKIIPLVVIIAMMGVFLGAIHPASAASTTEVKAYNYDPYDPPGIELNRDITIKNGESLDISATLHVNGGNPQWFRWLNFYIYNSKGEQIVNEERNTGFGGVARCYIKTKDWNPGTYKLSIVYPGNEKDGYPRAEKNITVHIK
jgi:hypothetical protein